MTKHLALALSTVLLAAPAAAKPTTQGVLPDVAKRTFVSLMRGTGVIPDKGWVSFKTSAGTAKQVKFDFKAGTKSGSAYATKYKGRWVFTPEAVGPKDLTAVTKSMVSYLKENFWQGGDATASQIAKYCKLVKPQRTFFKGESGDPDGLSSSYPMVFCFVNPTGSDHGFYTGYNPKTRATESYYFN
jgi:hypothetical protein